MRYLRSPHHQAAVFALFLAVAMLLPGGALPPEPTFDWVDKAIHLVLILIMTMLLIRSLTVLKRFQRPVLVAATLTLAYATLLELVQGLIPGRYLDSGDLVANALGVVAALLLQSMANRG